MTWQMFLCFGVQNNEVKNAAAVARFVRGHRYMQALYYGIVNRTGSFRTGLALKIGKSVNRLIFNIPNSRNGYVW